MRKRKEVIAMKKQPTLLTPRFSDLADTVSARHFLGKKVYSTSGDHVGRVHDVVLKNNALAGLLVVGKKLLFIDYEYCTSGAVDGIVLKIDPVTMLKGKIVFDSQGRKLGKVKSIERENNKNYCSKLVVRKGLFSRPRLIPYDEVEVSKKNIILSRAYDE